MAFHHRDKTNVNDTLVLNPDKANYRHWIWEVVHINVVFSHSHSNKGISQLQRSAHCFFVSRTVCEQELLANPCSRRESNHITKVEFLNALQCRKKCHQVVDCGLMWIQWIKLTNTVADLASQTAWSEPTNYHGICTRSFYLFIQSHVFCKLLIRPETCYGARNIWTGRK